MQHNLLKYEKKGASCIRCVCVCVLNYHLLLLQNYSDFIFSFLLDIIDHYCVKKKNERKVVRYYVMKERALFSVVYIHTMPNITMARGFIDMYFYQIMAVILK